MTFLKSYQGFTLVELLITLQILAIIAIFTIPKILYAQQNNQYRAEAKEVAAMISGSYQQALQDGSMTTTTKPSTLSKYMNYLSKNTTASIDQEYSSANGVAQNCSANNPCLRLHNGGTLLFYDDAGGFAGTGSTNAVFFDFDPDSKVTNGTTNGPGKTVEFVLYYTGRVTTHFEMAPNTQSSIGVLPMDVTSNPDWFSW